MKRVYATVRMIQVIAMFENTAHHERRCPRCLSLNRGLGPTCPVCSAEFVESQLLEENQEDVKTLFRRVSEDRKLRWIRAAVGGGIGGLVISVSFMFVDDGLQVAWMGAAIIGGVLVGLVVEWLHPWASDEPNRFLELVGAEWPTINGRTWTHDELTVYRFNLPRSIADESDRLRSFFHGLGKLDWKLVSEADSARLYHRRDLLLRVTVGGSDHAAALGLVVSRFPDSFPR